MLKDQCVLIFLAGAMKKYTIAPNGIKITIKAISSASLPSNLLLKISIIAITGSKSAKINITGIKINNNIVLSISVKFKSLYFSLYEYSGLSSFLVFN